LSVQNQDQTEALVTQVHQALETKTPVNIVGGGSKAFLGKSVDAQTLDMNGHVGVVSYEPTELVVTVRTGTPMSELNALLAQNRQTLPFEPPVFGSGTIGGVLACGLSGPARPFAGAARDYVLGMRVINGQGQALRFGGEVMKNVAGYDAARLHVGAYGTLGVLLEASMKVLPLPEAQITLRHELTQANDNTGLVRMMRQPLPLSAATIINNSQYIRLSGSESAVRAAAKTCGGDVVPDGEAFWQSIRELTHEFFNDQRPLWRLSVPEFSPLIQGDIDGEWLLDWAGAQRFLKTNTDASTIFSAATAASGHASCYSANKMANNVPLFQPLEGAMLSLQSRLRDSFDAHRLFNPGRYHPEMDTGLNDQTNSKQSTSNQRPA